jgi:hypothetical protein
MGIEGVHREIHYREFQIDTARTADGPALVIIDGTQTALVFVLGEEVAKTVAVGLIDAIDHQLV